MYIVEVIIEHPLRHLDMTFSYLSKTHILPGIRVHVPFGNQNIVGYVQAVKTTSLSQEELELQNGIQYKFITDCIDEKPILTEELFQLAKGLAKHIFSPVVSCLKTMLPPPLKPSSHAKITHRYVKYIKFIKIVEKTTNRQLDFLMNLKRINEVPLKEAGISNSMIKTLVHNGAIEIIEKEELRQPASLLEIHQESHHLTSEQNAVLNSLFSNTDLKPFLLFGITGSGKTEVYLNAAKKMIEQGKQVLMLVPEISLAPKIVALFKQRFNNQVAILHSRLSDGERYDEYRRVLNNEVKIVVGARSAVFAPLNNIGLIVLDEEHDASYKQNNIPYYHTRDVALWRANYHHAKVVLGSASPSIESYAKAMSRQYHLLKMTTRPNAYQLPSYEIIDMAKEAQKGNLGLFSNAFKYEMHQCLKNHKQALILVNRRGYATYLLCKDCGYVPKCPHCDVSLTYHKQSNSLVCHYCGYEIPYKKECSSCGSKQVGFKGSGTEHIEETIQQEFPEAKIIRYDMDTTRLKHAHEKLLNQFQNHEANVLLGTQMIAKGLDFEDVTFVGVIDGDGALNLPDYRASERTFQLLLQVAGRAGRHQDKSKVVIQSYNPKHYAVLFGAKQDYESFYKAEIIARKEAMYPPFCYFSSILFSDTNENEVIKCANWIAENLKTKLNADILGPSPSVLSKINNRFRYRLTIKYKNPKEFTSILVDIISQYRGKVKIEVDVNPYSQM